MGASTSKLEYGKKLLERISDTSQYEGIRKDYKYENLVFEGGGAKGVAYCGAVKVLEDLGILQNIKRYAGTSIGSLTALILALGGTTADLTAASLENLETLVADSNKLSLVLNIWTRFGWHPADRLLRFLKDIVKNFTGDPDITFEGLYKQSGVELCIIVTNISACNIEYCHVKTTPELSIAVAVKMSMSLPFLLQPKSIYDRIHREHHIYVDGGIVLNYPINAFDGWFLNLDHKDSFFHRIGSSDPMFEPENRKTLGFKVFDALENESDQLTYLSRYPATSLERPNSDLAVAKARRIDALMKEKERKLKMIAAAERFTMFMSGCDKDGSGTVSLEEFKAGLIKIHVGYGSKKEFCYQDWKILFDYDDTSSPEEMVDTLFREIDTSGDKEITFNELLCYMSGKGVPLRQMMFRGTPRQDITGLPGFLGSLVETFQVRIRALTMRPDEATRTIGIYTDYVGTTDMLMAIKDKEYIIKQGWHAAVGFFKGQQETT